MDLTSSAIVSDDVAFQVGESTSVPLFISPVEVKLETADASETDFELAQKAGRGNVAAFELIYQKYHRLDERDIVRHKLVKRIVRA